MNKPLIVLTGPTAVGKTKLSIRIAKEVNGEIISADSMQVYRHMDIGSAKIRKEEMEGVKHYLVDILEPDEEFNVVIFQKLCLEAISEIYNKGKIPILVGGTGFYIQAVLYGIAFEEESEESSVRNRYEQLVRENPQGASLLHKKLAEVDPLSADCIHENNVKRVIRALEFYERNSQPISKHNLEQRKKESPYQFAYFVLNQDRQELYRKIELRVDEMIREGLVSEVEALKNKGFHKNMVSMQGIGYKEILQYLDGELSYDEAISKMKLNTRHFAKRQLTWFRREKDVIWLNKEEYQNNEDNILKEIKRILRSKGIIDE